MEELFNVVIFTSLCQFNICMTNVVQCDDRDWRGWWT